MKIYIIIHYFYHNANIFYQSRQDAVKKVEELAETTGSNIYEWYIMEITEGKRFDVINKWKEF
jgi:hypothetical protein